jgi:predicted HTH transcriptional regulator
MSMASQPSASQELIAILLQGHESKELDYKCGMAWKEADKKSCCELVKDILAMANTRGGFIAIGVSEQPNGYSFDGVTVDQAETFDTSRLNRFLQSYADPPINALLRKVKHEGRIFVLIEVPAFTDTPHILPEGPPGRPLFTGPVRSQRQQ